MLRAHARTDSKLSTHDYAEAPPTRELLAADDALALAHVHQIPFSLPKRVARGRALFFRSVLFGGSCARVASRRRSLNQDSR
jgi:hypothetical protein